LDRHHAGLRRPCPAALLARLMCPACGGLVEKTDHGVSCILCRISYSYVSEGALDLRLAQPRHVNLSYELGRDLPGCDFELGAPLPPVTRQVDFTGVPLPHISPALVSYVPKASSSESLMLDLGAGGEGIHRPLAQRAGFLYVGVDYYWPTVDILGDAHALPFVDNTFDFVMAIAVWEHLRFPLLAIREVARVLKPGGRFIGTVAFLEPYHSNSYFHHSHLGTYNVLTFGGLDVIGLAASAEWSVLTAQASMTLFPGIPDAMSRALVWPLAQVHKAWWRVRRPGHELRRIRETTGAFEFVAHKPSGGDAGARRTTCAF
jgi:SAM-dependent methyltransferase